MALPIQSPDSPPHDSLLLLSPFDSSAPRKPEQALPSGFALPTAMTVLEQSFRAPRGDEEDSRELYLYLLSGQSGLHDRQSYALGVAEAAEETLWEELQRCVPSAREMTVAQLRRRAVPDYLALGAAGLNGNVQEALQSLKTVGGFPFVLEMLYNKPSDVEIGAQEAKYEGRTSPGRANDILAPGHLSAFNFLMAALEHSPDASARLGDEGEPLVKRLAYLASVTDSVKQLTSNLNGLYCLMESKLVTLAQQYPGWRNRRPSYSLYKQMVSSFF